MFDGGSHDNARMRRVVVAGMKEELPRSMRLITAEAMKNLEEADETAQVDAERREAEWWRSRAGRDALHPGLVDGL